jgi:starvation-inducible outer membrane lipoprotein
MKMFRALTNAAILAAVLITVALLLSGCIVEPVPVHFQPIVRVR